MLKYFKTRQGVEEHLSELGVSSEHYKHHCGGMYSLYRANCYKKPNGEKIYVNEHQGLYRSVYWITTEYLRIEKTEYSEGLMDYFFCFISSMDESNQARVDEAYSALIDYAKKK